MPDARDMGAPELLESAREILEAGRELWEHTPTLTWVQDHTGRLFHCGSAGLDGAGSEADAAPDFPAEVIRRFSAEERAGLQEHRVVQDVERVIAPDGTVRHFLVVRFPFGVHGAAEPYVGTVALDITRHKRRVDELARLAVDDELTGLYNRRGFMLFAGHELRAARRRLSHSAVVFVDVDGLARCNDELGRDHGNAVLVETAQLLRATFRECDVIARVGGDEFAVFAADVRGEPEQLRERLAAQVAERAAEQPNRPRPLSLSAGLAYSRAGEARGLAQLVAEADVAMHAGRAAKRGR